MDILKKIAKGICYLSTLPITMGLMIKYGFWYGLLYLISYLILLIFVLNKTGCFEMMSEEELIKIKEFRQDKKYIGVCYDIDGEPMGRWVDANGKIYEV